MGPNIKDPKAHRLGRRKVKASVEELRVIARRAAAVVQEGPHLDHAAYLYDENGLPK
jgi:hypothetical protein